MYQTLAIINDFLPPARFYHIRDVVRFHGFRTEKIQEQTGTDVPPVEYQNVNMEVFPDFEKLLSDFIGTNIKMEIQAFRHGFKGSQLHNKVHADHCCAPVASVLYMNDLKDCVGGTAFWRHKKHGWEFMPTKEQLEETGYSLAELAEDWKNEEAWDMVTLAGMRTNRMIIYPSKAFHSRYPFEGVGPESNGRLIWCGFFSL